MVVRVVCAGGATCYRRLWQTHELCVDSINHQLLLANGPQKNRQEQVGEFTVRTGWACGGGKGEAVGRVAGRVTWTGGAEVYKGGPAPELERLPRRRGGREGAVIRDGLKTGAEWG